MEHIGQQLAGKGGAEDVGAREKGGIVQGIVRMRLDHQGDPPQRPVPQPFIQRPLLGRAHDPQVGQVLGEQHRPRPGVDPPAEEKAGQRPAPARGERLQRLLYCKILVKRAGNVDALRPLEAVDPPHPRGAAVKKAVPAGDIGVKGIDLVQALVERLGPAEHPGRVLKKIKRDALPDQAEGKVEMRPRHIDAGEGGQGEGEKLPAGALRVRRHLRFVPVGDAQVGEKPHLVKKAAAGEPAVLRVFVHDKIGQKQHRPFPRMEQKTVQEDLKQLVGADGVV